MKKNRERTFFVKTVHKIFTQVILKHKLHNAEIFDFQQVVQSMNSKLESTHNPFEIEAI